MSATVKHTRMSHYVDVRNGSRVVCRLRCNDYALLKRIVKLNWGIDI